MNFKDLKPGSQIYLFDRDKIDVKTGIVSSVSAPHLEAKIGNPCQLVVDITVNLEGENITYIAQDTVSVTYCGSTTVSCNKDYILNELKGIRSGLEQVICNIDTTKEKKTRCDKAISELDDEYREKQQMESRLQSIEQGQKEMQELIKQFINKKL